MLTRQGQVTLKKTGQTARLPKGFVQKGDAGNWKFHLMPFFAYLHGAYTRPLVCL